MQGDGDYGRLFCWQIKTLCNDYYYEYMDMPPCPVASYSCMNLLLGGTRKPTMCELAKTSQAFNVSINYLLIGDEMFPSLHRIERKKAERILGMIEELKPDPKC